MGGKATLQHQFDTHPPPREEALLAWDRRAQPQPTQIASDWWQ